MLVLGLESTCDESASAVVEDGKRILSNVVSTQIELHRHFGGVVPELACRRHVDIMIPVVVEALKRGGVTLDDINLIAVSYAPGLIGALLIGLNAAKALSWATSKPFVGVNHVEAHLYAAFMDSTIDVPMPCLGAVLSGGHTALCVIRDIGDYQLIGRTIDDAIGEAFDKTAKVLGLPYPGGPVVEALARQGDENRYKLHGGRVKGQPLNFSFSGLKTAVLYAACGQNCESSREINEQDKADLCASFQRAAFDDVIEKIGLAAKEYDLSTVALGGGVTNNSYFRAKLAKKYPHLQLLWPAPALTLDNAAMIAGLGYWRYRKQGCSDPMTLEASPRTSHF